MERIRLSKLERKFFLYLNASSRESSKIPPRDISLISCHYCLATLQGKGLIQFQANYDEVHQSCLSIKGAAYLEQNPRLKNPVDIESIVTLAVVIITALATTAALFVACNYRLLN